MQLKKLFVGNLPYSATGDDLRALFAEVGTVESAMVITDRMSGRSKGFGFVEMATLEEAEAAVAKFHNYDLNGRPMIVNEARPQEERPRGSFGGGRGGFGGGRSGDRGGFRGGDRGSFGGGNGGYDQDNQF
ncbi:RNA-binding protein [Candidatus Peregrinibacteria bacterium]|nr:MAG: RNA-binding protein [Candidatus Peregrinibacteria bacterium]